MKKTLLFLFIFLSVAGTKAFANEQNLITAVSDTAQKAGPAVVAIKTEQLMRYRANSNYFGRSYDDELMERFFEDFFGTAPQYAQKSLGIGSGVIIDRRGYILTNAHVVKDADKITVTLPDGRKFEGELTGTDMRSDLALIKITAENLPVATLGNSENLKIGQWVVAIGNPFGNVLDDPQPTVTSGVISALHRSLPQTSRLDSDYSDLIQTDAAINPGNSGGPLVNLDGDVIGINVAIFSTSGGYQGVGFAIPVNYAKAIVEQLAEGKTIDYGWIGIGIQDIDERLAQYFALTTDQGVLVTKVLSGAPAEQAGIREGDIILSVNKIKVRNSSALVKQISNAPIGTTVILQVSRDQKDIEIPVVIGKNESLSTPSIQTAQLEPKSQNIKSWRGLSVQEITAQKAQELGLANTNGVLIKEVGAGSPAQLSGLQKDDVIIAINKRPVENTRDYNQITQRTQGSCLVRTVRGFFVLEP